MSALESVFGQQTRRSCASKNKTHGAEVKGVNLSTAADAALFLLGLFFFLLNLCINEDDRLSACIGPAEPKGGRSSTFAAFEGFLDLPEDFKRFSVEICKTVPKR